MIFFFIYFLWCIFCFINFFLIFGIKNLIYIHVYFLDIIYMQWNEQIASMQLDQFEKWTPCVAYTQKKM